MEGNITFVIGRQRSGTTAFRDVLAVNGALDCNEIFHGDLNGQDTFYKWRFYNYVWMKIKENGRYIHPESHRDLFLDYLNYVSNQNIDKNIVMDIKYFALNLIPSYEDIMNSRPFIFEAIADKNYNIVHIVRRNKLRVLVSEVISYATGIWSVTYGSLASTKKSKVNIGPAYSLKFIQDQIDLDAKVSSMIKDFPGYSRIDYEDMFSSSGEISSSTIDIVCKCLKLDSIIPQTFQKKMNPEKLEMLIDNFRDIQKILKGTDYEWMIDAN